VAGAEASVVGADPMMAAQMGWGGGWGGGEGGRLGGGGGGGAEEREACVAERISEEMRAEPCNIGCRRLHYHLKE
jgi:hypothetical protein